MTTPAAERQYISEHLQVWSAASGVVFNPHGKPEENLPVIYGFNNGGSPQRLHGYLIAEDGTCLGAHSCSHEAYMPHDLGIIEGARPDRHEDFRKHYPDGYRMEFVTLELVGSHAGLTAAYNKNQQKRIDDKQAKLEGQV